MKLKYFTINTYNSKGKVKLRHRIWNYCKICEWPYPKMYMIQHKIWDKFFAQDDIVCLRCFVATIKRPLIKRDFMDVPMNEEIRLIYDMCNLKKT